jgi:hypothetical protein
MPRKKVVAVVEGGVKYGRVLGYARLAVIHRDTEALDNLDMALREIDDEGSYDDGAA